MEVWENEKCCGNTSRWRVFPLLLRVLPNLHEFFYNSIKKRRKCFLFLLERSKENNEKGRTLDSFIWHQNVHSLYRAIYRVIETRILTNLAREFSLSLFLKANTRSMSFFCVRHLWTWQSTCSLLVLLVIVVRISNNMW